MHELSRQVFSFDIPVPERQIVPILFNRMPLTCVSTKSSGQKETEGEKAISDYRESDKRRKRRMLDYMYDYYMINWHTEKQMQRCR
jgi:hypothetical protein